MHLDHVAASGARMERVDVLGDDCLDEPAPLELGQAQVTGVRLGREQQVDTRAVELPHATRIGEKRLDGRDLERIDVLPDPALRPEVGDAALRRDTGSREDDAWLSLAKRGGQCVDRHRGILGFA